MKLTKTQITEIYSTYGSKAPLIFKSIKFADKKHKGILRDDGTPYITHPLRVAEYVRQYKIFNVFNGIFMVFLVCIVVIPLLYLLANAFSDGAAKHAVVFFPKIIIALVLIPWALAILELIPVALIPIPISVPKNQ